MNILFTLCARAGSKGLKSKNIRSFLGAPLVSYTIAAMRLYKEQDNTGDNFGVCLNTDSEELIAQVLEQEPSTFVVRRTQELSGDTVAKIAVIKDCLKKAEEHLEMSFDLVVDLDITSPLRKVKDIKNAVQKKQQERSLELVFSVTSARRSPYFNMVKQNSDGTVSKVMDSNFTARQQAPELFDMNASIYVYEANFLRSNTSNMLFDASCGIVQMIDTAVLDIDSEEDFFLMQIIGKYFYESDQEYGEIFAAIDELRK